ncbi:Histidine--tRNA ligase [compost metagenome]
MTLDNLGIEYIVDKKIVRGLDYYNKTVYEYTSKDLGLAAGGGGRYDTLVTVLGGTSTPAVGFGLGMDRIILMLKEQNVLESLKTNVDIYFLAMGNNAKVVSVKLANDLRVSNYIIETDISDRSFKAQMKYANNINARYICIIGDDEINNNNCIVKNMDSGEQFTVSLNAEEIAKNIK